MFRKKKKDKGKTANTHYPTINASLKDVKEAIHSFITKAPDGVRLSVLITDDHSIDTELLAPHLKGIPDQAFYMSKTTYEVFDHTEKDIPVWMDLVQNAVDDYFHLTGDLPIIEGDPLHKVSYYKLQGKNLLKEKPPIDFYITNQEFMITHRKP